MDENWENSQASMSGTAYADMIKSAQNVGFVGGLLVASYLYSKDSSSSDCKNIVSDGKIESLPSDDYEVLSSIDVKFQYLEGEVLALQTDLELYGEGENQFEAVNDLKLEILDLADDLFNASESELGKHPKAWKKAIMRMLKKCQ